MLKRRDFAAASSQLHRTAEGASPHAREHLLSIEAQLDAIARGDFDAVFDSAHDEVTLEIFAPPEFPWIRQTRGIAELRHAIAQNFGSVDDQQPEIRDVFVEGDTVILFGRERGAIRQTGRRYDMEFVQRFSFREGRLASVRIVAAHAATR